MKSLVVLFAVVCLVAVAQAGVLTRTAGIGAGDGIITLFTGLGDGKEALGTGLGTLTDLLHFNIPGAIHTAVSGTSRIVSRTANGAITDTDITVNGGLGDVSDLLHLRLF